MTQQPERDALEAAARAINEQSFQNAIATLGEPDTFESWSLDSGNLRAFLASYLAALSAQGMRVMPREPTPAMHVRGMDCRRVQDNLNKVHSVIIDTSEIWREMFDAAYGGAK